MLDEMPAGERAFRRDTAAETLTAILREEPLDLLMARGDLPAALERIVRHCLEKNPAESQTATVESAAQAAIHIQRSRDVPAQVDELRRVV